MIKFQHYYRFAVMNNIGDSEAMLYGPHYFIVLVLTSHHNMKSAQIMQRAGVLFNKAVATGELPPPHTDNIKTP